METGEFCDSKGVPGFQAETNASAVARLCRHRRSGPIYRPRLILHVFQQSPALAQPERTRPGHTACHGHGNNHYFHTILLGQI